MGGWGSGRQDGRPTASASRRVDLTWMLRERLARPSQRRSGTISYTCGGRDSGSISYVAAMQEPGEERLELSYTRGSGDEREHVHQTVRLCFTVPNFGGKRWWMICPYRGIRVGKLYMPPGGDRFASRQAWRLAYQSQRAAPRDKPFSALFRLQNKLGCPEGWEMPIRRPKGMWRRTFELHQERYWELDRECSLEMMGVMRRLEK